MLRPEGRVVADTHLHICRKKTLDLPCRRSVFILIRLLNRGVAQLVARTAGGREVAGSSPVTPTNYRYLKAPGYPDACFYRTSRITSSLRVYFLTPWEYVHLILGGIPAFSASSKIFTGTFDE